MDVIVWYEFPFPCGSYQISLSKRLPFWFSFWKTIRTLSIWMTGLTTNETWTKTFLWLPFSSPCNGRAARFALARRARCKWVPCASWIQGRTKTTHFRYLSLQALNEFSKYLTSCYCPTNILFKVFFKIYFVLSSTYFIFELTTWYWRYNQI